MHLESSKLSLWSPIRYQLLPFLCCDREKHGWSAIGAGLSSHEIYGTWLPKIFRGWVYSCVHPTSFPFVLLLALPRASDMNNRCLQYCVSHISFCLFTIQWAEYETSYYYKVADDLLFSLVCDLAYSDMVITMDKLYVEMGEYGVLNIWTPIFSCRWLCIKKLFVFGSLWLCDLLLFLSSTILDLSVSNYEAWNLFLVLFFAFYLCIMKWTYKSKLIN